jgi:LuxR family maltose regulon positive regulatory protein
MGEKNPISSKSLHKEMAKADPLVRTKLHPPFIRPQLISRPELQARILDGTHFPLTLVVAPAGFGKTTLVAASLANCSNPVAWLALDKNDNQVERFLSYLIAALQSLDDQVGVEASQLLAGMQPTSPEKVFASLINDLDGATGEKVLVLEDYQVIFNHAVHAGVTFILDHSPKTFHLVIATRSDPPLPVARLRARGQMVELRGTDLQFTAFEAAQFFKEIMGLQLDDGIITLIEERTEGWVAGLQMAALSLRDHKDIQRFIQGFSGTNRFIMDYLLEEVLASQTPQIQRFLLDTSILERLSAPLCNALLALDQNPYGDESLDSICSDTYSCTQAAAFLEYLERQNLFLTPLDDDRTWYRYHHLFVDLLRSRQDTLYPGRSLRLHAQAAAWFENEGMTIEAINHALLAREFNQAARLVEEHTKQLIAQGELNALMSWIEALPTGLRLTRPWLCIHQAYAVMLAGRPVEVEPLLSQAETTLISANDLRMAGKTNQASEISGFTISEDETRALHGAIAAVRAFTAVIMGQNVEGLSQALLARELLPIKDLFDQSLVAWAFGRIMQMEGNLSEARNAFEEDIRLGRLMGNTWTLLAAQTHLAAVMQTQGLLFQARAVLTEALAEANRQGARSRGYMAWVEDGLASLLYEQNELEEANRLLTDAIELTRQWPNPNHLIYAYALQARVLLAWGDLRGAQKYITEADQVLRSALLTRSLRYTVEADIVRIWLGLQTAGVDFDPDDLVSNQANGIITAWHDQLASAVDDGKMLKECDQIAALTLARVSLAAGRREEARRMLELVTLSARSAGYIGTAISSLILTAIACQDHRAGSAPGDRQIQQAFPALDEALALAQAGGFARIFLDEGQSMRMLIAQRMAHNLPKNLGIYATRLLTQFNDEPGGIHVAQGSVSPNAKLIESLSERELEVLHLLELGKTNQEIAGHLIVAPGTIKAHTASIYRKLDVTNRTEAVARARQLGLIP